MLNQKQALAPFEREAVLFDGEEGVPLFRVKQLFGGETIDFIFRYYRRSPSRNKRSKIFCTEKCVCEYFNLQVFLYAAACANAEEIASHIGEIGVKPGAPL